MPTCRPSSKVADSQRKKPQKKQALASRTREDEEEEEEEDEEEQDMSVKKDRKKQPVGPIRKQRVSRASTPEAFCSSCCSASTFLLCLFPSG